VVVEKPFRGYIRQVYKTLMIANTNNRNFRRNDNVEWIGISWGKVKVEAFMQTLFKINIKLVASDFLEGYALWIFSIVHIFYLFRTMVFLMIFTAGYTDSWLEGKFSVTSLILTTLLFNE
jgi:hypothetical protein